MSVIKIKGSSANTGDFTIQPPDSATDRTLTLPDKAGVIAAGVGTIVQVVQSTYSTLTTISTDTYTDTGLSGSITPTSSSNKILVITNQQYQWLRNNVDQGAGIRLLRDSTEIWAPPFGAGPYYNYTDNSAENNNYANIIYLDSPATTSSVTYKTQGRPYTTGSNGRVRFQVENVVSTILLMEVIA